MNVSTLYMHIDTCTNLDHTGNRHYISPMGCFISLDKPCATDLSVAMNPLCLPAPLQPGERGLLSGLSESLTIPCGPKLCPGSLCEGGTVYFF